MQITAPNAAYDVIIVGLQWAWPIWTAGDAQIVPTTGATVGLTAG